MGTSANVTAGKPSKSGAVYRADLKDGLTIPTSTSTAMSTLTDYIDLGYISEDGVTNSNSASSNDIKAWGGDIVLNTLTDKPDTFKFTLLEALKEEVLKVVYGKDNVTKDESGEISVKANASEPEYGVYVIDMLLRDGKKKRIVIPNAKVSSIGDVTYKDDEAVNYEVTLACMPDANGNTHYEYIL